VVTRLAPVLAVVALLAAGCGGTRTVVRTVTVERPAAPPAAGDQRLFGHVVSLRRSGSGYVLRFDPAWFVSGVTANVAQAEDQGTRCAPAACPPVANDNYRIDESHRALTFLAPAGVHGTVLVKNAQNGGPFPADRITIAELARIVAGRSRLTLFEPLDSGVWVVVHVDTVRAFAQQYAP
jgi:hypothetical protein